MWPFQPSPARDILPSSSLNRKECLQAARPSGSTVRLSWWTSQRQLQRVAQSSELTCRPRPRRQRGWSGCLAPGGSGELARLETAHKHLAFPVGVCLLADCFFQSHGAALVSAYRRCWPHAWCCPSCSTCPDACLVPFRNWSWLRKHAISELGAIGHVLSPQVLFGTTPPGGFMRKTVADFAVECIRSDLAWKISASNSPADLFTDFASCHLHGSSDCWSLCSTFTE